MLFSSGQNKLVMFVILNLYLWPLIYFSSISDGSQKSYSVQTDMKMQVLQLKIGT